MIEIAVKLQSSSQHQNQALLSLDFAGTQSVDSRITFTRASTATRTNAQGRIESVASGTPRIDYDPVTLACKGLLIEEARTNLLTYSSDFDGTDWSKNNCAVTANATTAPDGTLTAEKLIENTASSVTHFLASNSYTATNTTLTFSVYVKASERSAVSLQISNYLNHAASVAFNLATLATSNATVGSTDYTGVSASITDSGNGWRRCSITATKGSVNNVNRCVVQVQSAYLTDNYTGDGTSGVYIWGAQLEAGSYPTSYIPTTTATVTRAAEVAVMTGANFSNWYRADEGTFLVQANSAYVVSGNRTAIRVDDTTDNNRIMSRAGGAGSQDYRVISGGSPVANLEGGNTLVANAVFAHALAYKLNDFAGAFNGSNLNTDTSGSVPTVTRICIGCDTTVAANAIGGHIRSLRYFPARLTNAQLQALTAA